MSIIVTGGAGFIGSHIVDKLINLGHNVVIIDNLSSGTKEFINPKAEFYKLDLNSSEIKSVFEKENITHVIHHAAQIDVQASLKNPIFDARNNLLGTIKLLEFCHTYNVNKIIYASSAAVYGKPDYLPVDEKHPIKAMSPYGITKHAPEHYLKMYNHLYNLDYTILRYANVYGPRQGIKGEGGVISIFINNILTGTSPVIYGDGKQTRDFIYVEDVVAANIKALTEGDNELLNISCNTQDSINHLYKLITEILGASKKAKYKKERDGDIRKSCLNNNKAKKSLNWQPDYDLKEGLIKTINYYDQLVDREKVAVTGEE